MKERITKDELRQLYLKQQMTDQEIANAVGYACKQTVYELRRKWNIKALSKWERHQIKPTPTQYQVIVGTLLGDGFLERNGTKGDSQSSLRIIHGPKQKDYLYWKYKYLESLCPSEPVETKRRQFRFSTYSHPYFSELRNQFYPNGKKILPEHILSQIKPIGIAVWFMDDGTNIHQGNLFRFSTCSFSYAEHELMQQMFQDRYNIKTEIKNYDYLRLAISKNDRNKFLKLIKPHVPKCMQYKTENKWDY